MQKVATAWVIYEMTGSEAWLGIDAFASGIPTVLLLPWGGVLAEPPHTLDLDECRECDHRSRAGGAQGRGCVARVAHGRGVGDQRRYPGDEGPGHGFSPADAGRGSGRAERYRT